MDEYADKNMEHSCFHSVLAAPIQAPKSYATLDQRVKRAITQPTGAELSYTL